MSRSRIGTFAVALLCLRLLAGADGVGRADRLHLQGGGIVETDTWRFEGDLLIYEGAGGSVGLPRSIVLRIEPTGAPSPDSARRSATRSSPRPEALPQTPVRPQPGPVAAPGPARRLADAQAALDRRDFETASTLYGVLLDEADPDFHVPRIGYALSLIALSEDATALGVVLEGLARDPSQPALLELMGDLRNREERVHDALESWRQAFERAPGDRLREKILKAERELHAGRDYALATSSHFNLRYDGQLDLDLADAVAEYLEEQFWAIADELDHAPRQPITVLLYPERKFRDVTLTPEWVAGLYDGKIRVPLGGLRRLNPVAAAVLRHELTHAVVHSKTRGHCPRWLHEGLAQRAEGRNLSRADLQQVRAHLRAGNPAAWETRGFSYPIALSLTSYLESRRGFGSLVDVLERLGQGYDLDAALERVYGADYARLCRDWAESLLAGRRR